MGRDEGIGLTVAPACGFYLAPICALQLVMLFRTAVLYPALNYKLHAWKMAQTTAQAA